MLGDDLFIAQSVLHGTHRRGTGENMSALLDGGAGVQALGRDNSKIASRNLPRPRCRVDLRGKFRCAAHAQSVLSNGARMLLRSVVSVDLDIAEPSQMSADHAAQRPATYNADFHAINIPVSVSRHATGLTASSRMTHPR
jgi:hypothetical protein